MNHQNDPTDDPQLTAYALGELDLDEARVVRARITRDEAARQYVEQVQELAGALSSELHAAPAPMMSEQQRMAVRDAAIKPAPGPHPQARLLWPAAFAAAASIALVAGLTIFMLQQDGGQKDRPLVAMQDELGDSAPSATPRPATAEDFEYATPADRMLAAKPEAVAETEEVRQLLREVAEDRKHLDYDKALARIDEALKKEPNNLAAQATKEMIEGTLTYRNTEGIERSKPLELAQQGSELSTSRMSRTDPLSVASELKAEGEVRGRTPYEILNQTPERLAELQRRSERFNADRNAGQIVIAPNQQAKQSQALALGEERMMYEEEFSGRPVVAGRPGMPAPTTEGGARFDAAYFSEESMREGAVVGGYIIDHRAGKPVAGQQPAGETQVGLGVVAGERVVSRDQYGLTLDAKPHSSSMWSARDASGLAGAVVETAPITRGAVAVSGPQPVPMPGVRVPDLVTPAPAPTPLPYISDLQPAAPARPPLALVPAEPAEGRERLGKLVDDLEREEPANAEAYLPIIDNPFLRPTAEPLSTFSIDVDTASYANIRRFLNSGQLPPRDAVRIEEMLNYFSYDYAAPAGEQPFSANVEIATAPWNEAHRLVRIGLKGREIPQPKRPAGNFVFLIDVSGSMKSADKLPLLKQGLSLLLGELGAEDRLGIVTYAGKSAITLPSCSGDQHAVIQAAIDQLVAEGSTNGGAGIEQAYEMAARNMIPGGVNRVILATDGDFNVGVTQMADLQRLIESKRRTGVYLSVLGFGTGNLKDATMEMLADKGNGNYAYIDSVREAGKVLVEEMTSTLITIARDVKIQVEFNPALVESYRLIGYENRMMAAADFNNDRKDAGEIGAGHTVTALYEVAPAKKIGKPQSPATPVAGVDPLRYQRQVAAKNATELTETALSDELLTLKLRYKQPDGPTDAPSHLIEFPVRNQPGSWQEASSDFKFAAAVAAFGMNLRQSPHKGTTTYDLITHLATAPAPGKGDEAGYRSEFVDLVRKARNISRD